MAARQWGVGCHLAASQHACVHAQDIEYEHELLAVVSSSLRRRRAYVRTACPFFLATKPASRAAANHRTVSTAVARFRTIERHMLWGPIGMRAWTSATNRHASASLPLPIVVVEMAACSKSRDSTLTAGGLCVCVCVCVCANIAAVSQLATRQLASLQPPAQR